MIDKITYVESKEFNPYKNLAVEEYLLLHLEDKECILYLWQNQNTVVIGKNQNAWKECKISSLEEDGGYLARRLSGGGAVYHDLGNLNFTFLAKKENYNVKRQLEVILNAVRKLGIHAEKTGRNDIAIDGKKFSGNAFYEKDDRCYHHGTIMMDVNKNVLSKYLIVSKEKLQSKGVNSVKSRVTNLREYVPELTLERLKEVLVASFEEMYGSCLEKKSIDMLDTKEVESLTKKYESWEWLYGKKLDFQNEIAKRFVWGEVSIQFMVDKGIIQDVAVYSDALHTELIQAIPKYLKGIRYQRDCICSGLALYLSKDKQEEAMIQDMLAWIRTEEL